MKKKLGDCEVGDIVETRHGDKAKVVEHGPHNTVLIEFESDGLESYIGLSWWYPGTDEAEVIV